MSPMVLIYTQYWVFTASLLGRSQALQEYHHWPQEVLWALEVQLALEAQLAL